jgi:bifunctional non-homologous end joining protein LigD
MTVTHPERVLFPESGHKKGDVVAYYQRAATRMLPHLLHRPLTLNRFPRGIGHKGFFQKNTPDHYPDELIDRIELPRQGGVTVHPSVHDADGLAFLANQGVIEFHIPTVRAPELHHADRLIIDLDPPKGEVALVRRAAAATRALCTELGITTMPLATGSKGYHVIARIAPSVDLGTTSTAMQQLATLLVHRHDDIFTSAFRIERRGRRVFVDWMRNHYGATVIAPFSLRAREGAPVAVPLTWDELDERAPDAFNLDNIDARLEHDDPLDALEPQDARAICTRINEAFDEADLELEQFDRFRS